MKLCTEENIFNFHTRSLQESYVRVSSSSYVLLNFLLWNFTNHLFFINSSLVKSEKEAIIVHHWIQKWLRKMINLWIVKERLKTSAAFARHNVAKTIFGAHLKLFHPSPLCRVSQCKMTNLNPGQPGQSVIK